jgi:hypothetical protein
MSSLSLLAVLLTGLLALSLSRCTPTPRVVVLVPSGPLAHDIGPWLDSDLICVGLTPREALYVTRRCVPMKTIRTLILQTQVAGRP